MGICKEHERLDELEAEVEHLRERVDRFSDDLYDGFDAKVAFALQRILETHQAISIKSYLNDKEITTKLIRDELAELKTKQRLLEEALEKTNEALGSIQQ